MKSYLRNIRVPLALIAAILGSGCVATNLQKASPRTPPAVILNLPGKPASPLQVEMETVIVYDGPGSWKRRAFWDEYVVSVTNPGSAPVRLVAAELVDAQGEPLKPGDDWEDLERRSADWWKRNATAENFVRGAGIGVLAAAGGASALVLGVALLVGVAPLAGVAAGAFVVSAGSLQLMDLPKEDSRRAIAVEFNQRRLDLPRTVVPGDIVRGSLFFRITPSPRELVLSFEEGGRVQRIVVDLGALSGLHRKPPPTAANEPGKCRRSDSPSALVEANGGPGASRAACTTSAALAARECEPITIDSNADAPP